MKKIHTFKYIPIVLLTVASLITSANAQLQPSVNLNVKFNLEYNHTYISQPNSKVEFESRPYDIYDHTVIARVRFNI